MSYRDKYMQTPAFRMLQKQHAKTLRVVATLLYIAAGLDLLRLILSLSGALGPVNMGLTVFSGLAVVYLPILATVLLRMARQKAALEAEAVEAEAAQSAA
jgi:hypothetical protein